MTLQISPRCIVSLLIAVIFVLSILSVAAQAVGVVTDSDHVRAATRTFKVDKEHSIPTYFSALLLLIASVLLMLVARINRRSSDARRWMGLAIIFLYLSVDEACAIHDLAVVPLREALDADGFLFFSWVIPGAALLVIFGLTYFRFWLHLQPDFRRSFATAGLLYVGAALGLEMVGASIAAEYGLADVGYALVALCEELFEMVAIVIFIRALLVYLGQEVGWVQLTIETESLQTQIEAPPEQPLIEAVQSMASAR